LHGQQNESDRTDKGKYEKHYHNSSDTGAQEKIFEKLIAARDKESKKRDKESNRKNKDNESSGKKVLKMSTGGKGSVSWEDNAAIDISKLL
jgi:hypothetical protein